jgi:LCP family protein required for cell wall assembly
MPRQLYTTRTQLPSTCYNPTSMNNYNPIELKRRSTSETSRTSRIHMSPVLWGLLVVFLIILIATVYLTYSVARDSTAARINLNNPGLSLTEVASGNIPGINVNEPLQPETGPTPIPWDGANRVTILVFGLGACGDCKPGDPTQTDSMMLLTMDPVSRTIGILSIPRDLWVNIPGFDYGKINQAYFIGEIYDLPGGGAGLAIQTVQNLLGIDINYYAQVDFSAFENFINDIGGIEIDIPEEISVDPIGQHNTVILQPGVQLLDGPVALAYARNREVGADYARMDRQQQVILAIRDRVLSLDMLTNLITNAPTMYNDLRSGIHSNLNLQEAISLAWTASQVPRENFHRGIIGVNETTQTYSADGMDILLPDMDAVRTVRDEVFSTTSGVAPIATVYISNPEELRQAEAATVSVLNATTTAGLASQTTEYLSSLGINVTETGNADEESAATVIIDYTGKPYTVQYLVELLNIQSNSIYSRYDPNSLVDIAILVGTDWSENNSMP